MERKEYRRSLKHKKVQVLALMMLNPRMEYTTKDLADQLGIQGKDPRSKIRAWISQLRYEGFSLDSFEENGNVYHYYNPDTAIHHAFFVHANM